MPEYCNADGTRQLTSGVTVGATRVPAGSGRYA
jgi:hypothetical protein